MIPNEPDPGNAGVGRNTGYRATGTTVPRHTLSAGCICRYHRIVSGKQAPPAHDFMRIYVRALTVALLFLSGQISAQTQTILRLLDAATGSPIEVATVADLEGKPLEQAATDGRVTLPSGAAFVLAPGYRAYRLTGKEGSTVRLSPLSANLPEVVAEGIRPQTFSLTDVTLTGSRGVAKLGQGQSANLGQDIPYLIQQTPSAVTTSDAGTGVGYTSLRIRGSDATRTNVTLDGVPVNDAESQATYWVDLPDLASSVSNVTVVRGVGSSTSGPGAFGAGVLLQTRQPSDTAFITADNSGGSFGTRRHSFQVGTGRFGKGFSAEARLSRIASNGYVDRATADLYSYLGVVRYRSERGFTARLLHTSGHERTYQSWNGVEKAQADTNPTFNSCGTDYGQKAVPHKNEVDDYRQDYWQLHVGSPLGRGWRVGAALFYTFGQGYYEQYKVGADVASYGLPPAPGDTVTTTDLVRRRWLRNHYYGLTGTLQYDTGRHSFTFGTLASRYDGQNFGRIIWAQTQAVPAPDYQYYSGKTLKQEVSAFAKYIYTLPSGLSFYGDAQIRSLNYRISGTDNDGALPNLNKRWLFFNPKAGIGYDAGRAGRISLSAAVAHREPTRTTFTDTRGGTDPRPETLIDYEIGYRTQVGKLRPELTVFYMDYYDQLVQTGQLNDVGNVIFKNVDRSYRAGVELQANYVYSPKLVLGGSVSLSQNRLKVYTDTLSDAGGNPVATTFKDKAIALSPAVTAQGRITWMPVSNLEATLLARYIGRQYLDNTERKDLSLAPYALADFRIAYQLPASGLAHTIRLTFQVNNLTNARYSNNGYVYYNQAYVYPQAGRNFLAGLLISL